jgi:4-aminobutyrate aminotransferase-like enzyme
LDQNLLVGVSGDMLRINPPLTITPEQASRATAALAAALASPGWAES